MARGTTMVANEVQLEQLALARDAQGLLYHRFVAAQVADYVTRQSPEQPDSLIYVTARRVQGLTVGAFKARMLQADPATLPDRDTMGVWLAVAVSATEAHVRAARLELASEVTRYANKASLKAPLYIKIATEVMDDLRWYDKTEKHITYKMPTLGRMPDLTVRDYVDLEVAYASAKGTPYAVIDGAISMYVPDAAMRDDGPYRHVDFKDHDEVLSAMIAWSQGVLKPAETRGGDMSPAAEVLRTLVPATNSSDMGPSLVPCRRGIVDASRLPLVMRPYTPDDYLVGKWAGIDLAADPATGLVIEPPDEPIDLGDGGDAMTLDELMRGLTLSAGAWEDPAPDEERRALLRDSMYHSLVQMARCMILNGRAWGLFLLMGGGGDGKSTWLGIIRRMVGPKSTARAGDNVLDRGAIASVGPTDMDDQYRVASLRGAVANISDEVPVGAFTKDNRTLKLVESHEPITGRMPYGKPATFTARLTCAYLLNDVIRSKDQTRGWNRRLVPMLFGKRGFADRKAVKDVMVEDIRVSTRLAWLALNAPDPDWEHNPGAYVQSSKFEYTSQADPVATAALTVVSDYLDDPDDPGHPIVPELPMEVFYALMSVSVYRASSGGRVQLPSMQGPTFADRMDRALERTSWEREVGDAGGQVRKVCGQPFTARDFPGCEKPDSWAMHACDLAAEKLACAVGLVHDESHGGGLYRREWSRCRDGYTARPGDRAPGLDVIADYVNGGREGKRLRGWVRCTESVSTDASGRPYTQHKGLLGKPLGGSHVYSVMDDGTPVLDSTSKDFHAYLVRMGIVFDTNDKTKKE